MKCSVFCNTVYSVSVCMGVCLVRACVCVGVCVYDPGGLRESSCVSMGGWPLGAGWSNILGEGLWKELEQQRGKEPVQERLPGGLH